VERGSEAGCSTPRSEALAAGKHLERGNMKPKTEAELDSRLTAYESSLPSHGTGSRLSDRLARWPMYAAAAGSALTLSPAAVAGIVYSGPQNITVTSLNVPFAINIDGQGNNFSFNLLHSSHSGSGAAFSYRNAFLAGGVASERIMGTGTHAARLASGAPISTGAKFGGPSVNRLFEHRNSRNTTGSWSRNDGNWTPGAAPAFLGVEFFEGGLGHFGWIELQVLNGPFGYGYNINVTGWAYNTTAGAAIDAGQTSSIPEPGSLSLALLAAGSAGVLAWRRRRAEIKMRTSEEAAN
jgi:PEP-CTERM motif